jgi:hypothetical protein
MAAKARASVVALQAQSDLAGAIAADPASPIPTVIPVDVTPVTSAEPAPVVPVDTTLGQGSAPVAPPVG